MAKTTSIEWCDHTWTPVVGCDAVSPACANCYAALMAARLEAMGQEKYRGVALRAGGKGKWTGKAAGGDAAAAKWEMRTVGVDSQGVHFGDAWVSHESITGCSAEQKDHYIAIERIEKLLRTPGVSGMDKPVTEAKHG